MCILFYILSIGCVLICILYGKGVCVDFTAGVGERKRELEIIGGVYSGCTIIVSVGGVSFANEFVVTE